MNRYQFTVPSIKKAISFLKTKKGPKPTFLDKYSGEVKNGKLFLEGKMVIPSTHKASTLRKLVLGGTVPMTRDALYHYLKGQVVGISRQDIQNFLGKQRIIRETDNQQATTSRKKRKVNTKGQLHIDLVEVYWKDLPFEPNYPDPPGLTKAEKKQGVKVNPKGGYFFGCVDSLTALSWYKYAPRKSHRFITPLAKEAFQYMSKQLGVPLKKMTVKMDDGKEFDRPLYSKWGLKVFKVKSSPFIEGKNSHFQRVFYRVAKTYKTRNLTEMTKLSMAQLNRTVSSVTKKTPLEAVQTSTEALSSRYNSHRGKVSKSAVKLRPLKVGDRVRVRKIGDKDKSIKYKAYKGIMWSTEKYKVTRKQGNRYTVGGKSYHRDSLRLTAPYDTVSEQVIASRR